MDASRLKGGIRPSKTRGRFESICLGEGHFFEEEDLDISHIRELFPIAARN